LFIPALQLVEGVNDSMKLKLLEAYLQEMTAIHVGQGWDIEMQVNSRVPSTDDYKGTVSMKTGVFPRLLVKLIFTYYGNQIKGSADLQEKFILFCQYLSIAFQIKDDLLNLSDSQVAKSKGFVGEDIYEGKFSLMIIHSLGLKDNLKSIRLKEILDLKTKDPVLIKEAIDILVSNKSIQFAEEKMQFYTDKAMEICNDLESSSQNTDKVVVQDIRDLLMFLVNL